MRATIMAVGLALIAAPTAQAVENYDSCLALIAADPVRAERESGDWARYGGGAPARHCYALALIEIGAPSRAIDELLGIAAEEPALDDAARTEILVQAGEMLLEEGDAVTAAVVAEQAIRLVSNHSGALGLRAGVRLKTGEPRAAIRDLDTALATAPADTRLLLLRASAYRRMGQFIPARDDAVYATEVAPGAAGAWLERGRIEAELGDRPTARNSLLEAIGLDREGPIGDAARNILQRMDAGVD